MKIKLILCTFASAFAAVSFGQELLTNPGFETGDFTGWTVTHQGGFSGVGATPGTNHTGNFHLYMGATSAADQTDIFQDVTTTIGQTYNASFWAYDLDTVTTSANLAVTFGGMAVGPNRPAGAYTQYSLSFAATAATTRLEVTGWELTQYINSDDFSVQAVPEPASLACLGIGALVVLRRKRRK